MLTHEARQDVVKDISESRSGATSVVSSTSRTPIPIPINARKNLELPTSHTTGPVPRVGTSNQTTLSSFLTNRSSFTIPGTSASGSSGERSRRTCRRCGLGKEHCDGQSGIDKCLKPCQDCGRLGCSGRDPRNRPNRKCQYSGGDYIEK